MVYCDLVSEFKKKKMQSLKIIQKMYECFMKCIFKNILLTRAETD